MSGGSAEPTGREVIVATELTKWFGEGETKTIAVNKVDLVAYFGEMLYIVGPSGSGKTTTLSMLSGILRPNAGTVTVKGDNIWKMNNDQLADFRLNTIGFVFQDYHLFPRLTTAENVAIPLILKQRDWDESIAEARKYLEIVGLTKRADILPVKLSGGEQQRVAIARAISSGPDRQQTSRTDEGGRLELRHREPTEDRGHLHLRRCPQGSQDRAVRHLSRVEEGSDGSPESSAVRP